MIASDPQINCSTDFYERLVTMPGNSSSDWGVEAGVTKCGVSAGLLPSGQCDNNLSAFYVDTTPGGIKSYGCQDISNVNGDINSQMNLEVDDYLSNGGGIHLWFYFPGTLTYYICAGACTIVTNNTNTFQYNGFTEQLITGSFTNHKVWGSSWTGNQYDSTSGNGWHYQSNSGNPVSAGNPVQMGWHSSPNGSSNGGGTMYSCAYPSGTYTSCVLGS